MVFMGPPPSQPPSSSSPLMPGLPDDVAVDCLLRIPHSTFPSATSVSKRWHTQLTSPSFHRLRLASCLSRPAVVLSQSSAPPTSSKPSAAAYRLVLFDPSTKSWSSPPALPDGKTLPPFCQIAAGSRTIVVAGGWDPSTWVSSRDVFLYDLLSGAWHRTAPMPGPRRSFFACAVDPSGDAVYIAGGHDVGKNALRSAMRYDVASERWEPLPEMAVERDECKGVFRRGRFEVLGGYSTEAQGRFGGSTEGFDPVKGEWDPVEEGRLGDGGVNSCPRTCGVSGAGSLYRCSDGKVEVEEDCGGWRVVAEIPEGARMGTWVAMTGEGMVLVGGTRSHNAEHGVWSLEDGRWAEVAMPSEYTGIVQTASCFEF